MLKCRLSRGAATVELAILVPVLVLTLFLGVEVGRTIQARTLLVDGMHNSLLVGLHTIYSDPDTNLLYRNENKEYVLDSTVMDKMGTVLAAYVGNYDLLTPTRDYLCQCDPPPDDKETTATLGKVACDHTDIVACPDDSTQVYLIQSAGINFEHAFGGTINIGPLESVIRVK